MPRIKKSSAPHLCWLMAFVAIAGAYIETVKIAGDVEAGVCDLEEQSAKIRALPWPGDAEVGLVENEMALKKWCKNFGNR